MNYFRSLCEIYFSVALLIMIGALFVSRFWPNLRPHAKLQLSRILFAACLFSPLAVRLTEPSPAPLKETFKSLDDWTEQSKSQAAEKDFQLDIDPSTHQSFRLTSVHILTYLVLAWSVGFLWRCRRFVKDLKKTHLILHKAWTHHVIGLLHVKISDQCQIPFSVRMFKRAYIVLPISMLGDPVSIKIAVAHEGQHHRQGDCLFAYFFEAVSILFFWTPGMGRWRRVFGELQEFSCDEALIGHQSIAAHDYGRCLFEVAQAVMSDTNAFRRNIACVVGMADGSGKKELNILTRRIAMLSEYQSVGQRRMVLRSIMITLSIGTTLCAAYTARAAMAPPALETVDTSFLDPKLQEIATTEINAAVRRHKATSGAIALADAKTGRILAFAELRTNDQMESWITRTFTPASTIKPFVAAAAIEAGVAHEGKTYDCRQPHVIDGRKFTNYEDGFKNLTVTEALVKSVNICFIKMAQETGAEAVKTVMQRFGFQISNDVAVTSFGQSLPLAELAVGESTPVVTLATMTKAFATLANDGHSTDQKTVVSATTAKSIQNMLIAAVKEGTGKNASLPHLAVAGKTGTLTARPPLGSGEQQSNFGLFGGSIAAKHVTLAAYVVIEGSRINAAGGSSAAPVFREVMRRSLDVLQ